MKWSVTNIARCARLALLLCLPLGLAPAKEWKSYKYIDAVTTPAYKGLQKLAADFERATGGAIVIKLAVGGSLLIRANNITQAVADGVLPIADDRSAFVSSS
jgi:TRAP-type C4-dicarboxylate transport system substrate-binding protein